MRAFGGYGGVSILKYRRDLSGFSVLNFLTNQCFTVLRRKFLRRQTS